jgi:hypothetical protein
MTSEHAFTIDDEPGEPGSDDMHDADLTAARRQLERLNEMSEIGMEMIRHLPKPGANDRSPSKTVGETALAYARLSRAIRQIYVLEQEIRGLREKRRADILKQRARDDLVAVRSGVSHAIRANRPDAPGRDVRQAVERTLRDYNDYNDYGRGTVAETVARICRDLGIETDMSLWQPMDAANNSENAGDDARNSNGQDAKAKIGDAAESPGQPPPPQDHGMPFGPPPGHGPPSSHG